MLTLHIDFPMDEFVQTVGTHHGILKCFSLYLLVQIYPIELKGICSQVKVYCPDLDGPC